MSTPMFIDTVSSGTITAVSDEVVVDCNGAGSVIIQIDGYGDATLEFEANTDGTNWWSIPCLNILNIEPVDFTTTNSGGIGMWQVNAAGLNQFRVRCTAFSGTNSVPVTLKASAGASRTVVFPNDIEIKQGDPAANQTYGWFVRLTDGNYTASVNSNHALLVAQQGAWTTGRTWSLSSAGDSVNIGNFPSIQASSQSGTWNINNISGSIPLPSGAATSSNQTAGNNSLNSIDNKTPSLGQKAMLGSSPVVIASDQSSLPVTIGNFPSVQAVSGTFWQSTQPVSGPLTDTQLRASAIPVSGTFYQSVQPISGTISASQSGSWNVRLQDSFGTGLTTTSNNLDINIKNVSAETLGSISLGNSSGKTNIGQPGTKVTTSTTADQVITTYTVTSGKTFYLQGFDCIARLTSFASTATNYGTYSLEDPSGTKLYTGNIFHSGNGIPQGMKFDEPLPISSGTVVRLVCTPSAATSFIWQGNIVGYEK